MTQINKKNVQRQLIEQNLEKITGGLDMLPSSQERKPMKGGKPSKS